jgi:hypothetical protein
MVFPVGLTRACVGTGVEPLRGIIVVTTRIFVAGVGLFCAAPGEE